MENNDSTSPKKLILYVEDEDIQAKLFAKIIENEVKDRGHQVIIFNSGADFIDLVNSRNKNYTIEQFGIILLDLAMHDFSGIAMLKEAQDKAIKTPIAIFSAREDEALKKQSFDLGAKDYFVKGKDLLELERLRSFIIDNTEY